MDTNACEHTQINTYIYSLAGSATRTRHVTLVGCCRWIVMGIYMQPNAYFHDVSNWLDFAIATASLVGLPFPNMLLARFFRSLRPLRMVTKVQMLRMIISSLSKAMSKAMPVRTAPPRPLTSSRS